MNRDGEIIHFRHVSHWKLYIVILIFTFFVALVVSLNLGFKFIPFRDIVTILFEQIPGLNTLIDSSGMPQNIIDIISYVRLPRVICGALVGAGLATAGVTYQGIFRNPMADPYIIGASTGASAGSALVLVLGLGVPIFGITTLQIFAFVGSLLTVLFVYTLSRMGSRVPVTNLLLIGIAVSFLLNAIVTYLKTIASDRILHGLEFWLIGSLQPTEEWADVISIFPFVVIGAILCYMYSRDLNILALGEDEAQHLGVEIEKVKRISLVSGALMTAAAVSISGLIGFVGLIIPHLTRVILGPDHRLLIPASALVGASFLMLCDSLARVIMGSGEIPVGVITALAGAPFFIYLLRRKSKGYHM